MRNDEPKDHAQMWLDGGDDPSFDQIDGFLYRHFNARAVYLDTARSDPAADRVEEALSIAKHALNALSAERGGPDSSGAEDYDIEAMRADLATLDAVRSTAPATGDAVDPDAVFDADGNESHYPFSTAPATGGWTRATAKGTAIDVDEWDRPLFVSTVPATGPGLDGPNVVRMDRPAIAIAICRHQGHGHVGLGFATCDIGEQEAAAILELAALRAATEARSESEAPSDG